MLARGDKDGEFGSDDEEYLSIMTSAEDLSHRSLTSNPVSPKEQFGSEIASPSTNLDQELEKLLIEEARKQGIYDVDAVNNKFKILYSNFCFYYRAQSKVDNSFRIFLIIPSFRTIRRENLVDPLNEIKKCKFNLNRFSVKIIFEIFQKSNFVIKL